MSFAYKKSTQAINYFAIQNGGTIDKLRVLKLIFFADRYHLRKYGRPITNDEYWAMEFGPVASGVKDLAELDSISGKEKHYAMEFLRLGKPAHKLISRQAVDAAVFSESDLEALRFAWQHFGETKSLVDVTHLYPEWKRFEARLKTDTRARMSYADFLADPPAPHDPCYALTENERQDRLDQLQERDRIEALWS